MKALTCNDSNIDAKNAHLCACGCGEEFTAKWTGAKRFKRGHYRFIPDQHIIDHTSDCWIFTGAKTRRGHGLARNDQGVNEHAHRLYWLALVGPIPEGMTVHHLCPNRLCCNPAHLELMDSDEHQSLHAKQQWQRQRANPSEHHIGAKPRAHSSTPPLDPGTVPDLTVGDGPLSTICAWCQRVRGHDGVWRPQTTGVVAPVGSLTHGVCPQCADELCPPLTGAAATLPDGGPLSTSRSAR